MFSRLQELWCQEYTIHILCKTIPRESNILRFNDSLYGTFTILYIHIFGRRKENNIIDICTESIEQVTWIENSSTHSVTIRDNFDEQCKQILEAPLNDKLLVNLQINMRLHSYDDKKMLKFLNELSASNDKRFTFIKDVDDSTAEREFTQFYEYINKLIAECISTKTIQHANGDL